MEVQLCEPQKRAMCGSMKALEQRFIVLKVCMNLTQQIWVSVWYRWCSDFSPLKVFDSAIRWRRDSSSFTRPRRQCATSVHACQYLSFPWLASELE
ncbi:unnamed protein product [Soboliphyme baturini]|uniref:Uncharacterized protein n=1 Tax=Soboliphyme baturini TaxID=241478 RepID=A0A183IDU5_9BILA|nr:unnamed protein product [Soboliphyme baturini]